MNCGSPERGEPHSIVGMVEYLGLKTGLAESTYWLLRSGTCADDTGEARSGVELPIRARHTDGRVVMSTGFNPSRRRPVGFFLLLVLLVGTALLAAPVCATRQCR